MALNLTNEYIALTFQRLLQIDPSETPTGFKPFSLSDAINSDSATLINGVGERINGVVIDQFDQAGLFLKNTNTTFQIYSGEDFYGNQGISISKYDPTQLIPPGIFLKDNGDLVIGYAHDTSFQDFSLYVYKGIHIISQNGKSILKGKGFTSSNPYQESSEIRFYAKNVRDLSYTSTSGSIIGQGILVATPGGDAVLSGFSYQGYPLRVEIVITDLVAGMQIDFYFQIRTLPDITIPFEEVDEFYEVTLADAQNPLTFKTNFETFFNNVVSNATAVVDINSDEIIVTLSGNRVIPGPSPFYNSTYPHIWQLINPPPTGNNQSAVQVVVDLDKDIMDSGIFKRIDTNGNVKCSMIWRRVGNVIHVTGYRQPIGNATGDVDAVELLPVVPQSHVDDGDDVYNSLFGNGVLRDGDDASAPVPIICKANDQGGTIASQNCAVQFFRYDDLSNPIKDFGNGDIRFSFSYDLKN